MSDHLPPLETWVRQVILEGATRLLLRRDPLGAWIHLRGGVHPRQLSVSLDEYQGILDRLREVCPLDSAGASGIEEGDLQLPLEGSTVGLRVRVTPGIQGPSLVLSFQGLPLKKGLGALGLEPTQRSALEDFLAGGKGTLVVSGPTGSGRSSTLYSLLEVLLRAERFVVTVEHVIHRILSGATQVRVGSTQLGRAAGRGGGLAPDQVVDQVVKLDPEALFLAESRLWGNATGRAHPLLQRGRLLLLNDAGRSGAEVMREAAGRISPELFLHSPLLVVNQRLVPACCRECRRWDPLSREVLAELGFDEAGLREARAEGCEIGEDLSRLQVARSTGCRACRRRGKQGWVGAFEVLVADQIRRDRVVISHRAGPSLREHALRLALRGVVSLEDAMAECP